MQHCEVHEIAVSSLIDGELDHGPTLETIEHLLACKACASFFGEARALEGHVATLRRGHRPRTWKASSRPRVLRRAWTSAAAAALVLLGLALGRGIEDPSRAPGDARVAKVGDGGKMTDDRFVAVATELLEADARDQIEMLQVLQHVQSWRTEESPGQVAALRTDVDLSPRWSQLPLTGETHPVRDVY